jgi:hypothetical protein
MLDVRDGRRSRVMKLSDQDLDLPAGMSTDGQWLSARDLARKSIQFGSAPTPLAKLPEAARRAVVIERIRRKQDYGFMRIAGGEVTREEAVQAVEQGTDLGKLIEELESREVRIVQEAILQQAGLEDEPPEM